MPGKYTARVLIPATFDHEQTSPQVRMQNGNNRKESGIKSLMRLSLNRNVVQTNIIITVVAIHHTTPQQQIYLG